MTAAFWVGTPQKGHLLAYAHDDSKPDEVGAWTYTSAIMAYYWSWKYFADAESGQRVAAEWAWTRQRARDPAELAKCGPGAKFNFESDDTGWDVGFYLAAYDVTHDSVALTAAESSLDCAWRTWWDATSGGYWYTEKHGNKTMYQAVLTHDSEWAYRLTHKDIYRTRAVASEAWVAAHLRRGDGLYWKAVGADGSLPEQRIRYMINPGQSVTMIVGNMAQAIAEVWLYQDTHDPHYLARAQGTAAGIRRYEVDSSGVLIDDQDGFVNGWEMCPFAHDVVAVLSPPEKAAWGQALRTSALSVWQQDRRPDGSFGADWGGPPTGGAWEKHGQVVAAKITVSGGAVDVVVAGAIP